MRKKKLRIKHIILILSVVLLSFRSWKGIPKYYKNMLYVSSLNALYYVLCKRHLVWEFTPFGIRWGFIRFVHVVIITPLIVLTFLSKFPHSLMKQVIYTIKWTVIASIVEYFAYKQKLILYAHGWNIYWSGVIYALMYTQSNLITKKPLISLLVSFCSTAFFTIKFKVPIRWKHVSSKFEWLVDIYYHTFLEKLFSLMKHR